MVRLEDGLGWEQICPFMGIDIPHTPYPRGNIPGEFHKKALAHFYTHWWNGIKSLALVAVPAAAAAAAWYAYGHQLKGLGILI